MNVKFRVTRNPKTKSKQFEVALKSQRRWLAETPPSVLEDESKQAEDSGQTNVNDRNVNVMFGIPIKKR